MGESPQEQAAKQTYGKSSSLYDRMLSTDHFTQVAPEFDKIIQNLYTGFGQIKAGLTRDVSSRIGESLVTGGVARGHDMGGAWTNALTSALMPAIQSLQSQVADVGKTKALTYADILNRKDMNLIQLLGQQANITQLMKDSTIAGDILGGAQALAPLALGVYGVITGNLPLAAAIFGKALPSLTKKE